MRVIEILRKLLIAFSVIVAIMLLNLKVFAANYTLDVNFDGKNIEMISPTPDMTWEIKNLIPGEEQYNIVTVSNKGTRKVDVEFVTSTVSGEDVANVLDIKIIKLINDDPSLDETVYSGKYSEVAKVSFSIDVGKNQSYKIVVGLPRDVGNEFQGKECKMKMDFTAFGIEDGSDSNTNVNTDEPETPNEQNVPETEETPEVPANTEVQETPKQNGKIISTSTIKAPQTGESRWIFVIIGVLVVAFLGLLVSFVFTKKT